MTGVECGGGAQASLHPRPSLFHTQQSNQPTNQPTNQQELHPHVKTPCRRLEESRSARLLQCLASRTIEAELDSSLLQDREGFQLVVQRAYQSCKQAVQDQIARLTNDSPDESSQPNTQPQEVIEVRTSPAISGARITTNGAELPVTNRDAFRDAPSPRPATASQVKAIRAIAARRKTDLVGLLRERFGLTTADELGIRQARNLIDELKGDEPTNGHTNGNGAGTYVTTGCAR